MKIIESFQKLDAFLDGKKQVIASAGAALSTAAFIIHNVATQGWPYVATVIHSPEFATFALGAIGFFNARKGEKTRDEIKALTVVSAGILEQTAPKYVVQAHEQPAPEN